MTKFHYGVTTSHLKFPPPHVTHAYLIPWGMFMSLFDLYTSFTKLARPYDPLVRFTQNNTIASEFLNKPKNNAQVHISDCNDDKARF